MERAAADAPRTTHVEPDDADHARALSRIREAAAGELARLGTSAGTARDLAWTYALRHRAPDAGSARIAARGGSRARSATATS